MKIYHYHLATHEAIYADHEELALEILRERHPLAYEAFELTDVQDVPEPAHE